MLWSGRTPVHPKVREDALEYTYFTSRFDETGARFWTHWGGRRDHENNVAIAILPLQKSTDAITYAKLLSRNSVGHRHPIHHSGARPWHHFQLASQALTLLRLHLTIFLQANSLNFDEPACLRRLKRPYLVHRRLGSIVKLLSLRATTQNNAITLV
jgi:hypothetical protein